MRKRIIIALLAVFLVVIGFIVLPEVFSNEPTYHGKRLSFWFKQYYYSGFDSSAPDSIDYKDACDAFMAMGTNAVPWLIKRYLDADPDWPVRVKVQTFLYEKFHLPAYWGSDALSRNAAYVLWEIRPPAEMVLPTATNRLTSSDPAIRENAIGLLGCIGSNAELAVPWLRQYLQPTNEHLGDAIFSLSLLGKAATPALPELIQDLAGSNSNRSRSYSTCRALQKIGPPASNAVSVLESILKFETNHHERFSLAATLFVIDAKRTNELFAVIRETTNASTLNAHLLLLGDLGPNARGASTILAEILRGDATNHWWSAAAALWKIGETNIVLAILTEKMKSLDAKTRVVAAAAMLDANPRNELAISNLLVSVRDSTVASDAAAELVRVRPVPLVAASVLREIAADPKSTSRKNAIKALEVLSWQEKDEAKKR